MNLTNSIEIQSRNWKGSIPIMLSLAPSSLSSPTMPPPVHRMVSRQAYLHIALEQEVRRFHEYAPMVVSFNSINQSESADSNDDSNGDRNGDSNGDTSLSKKSQEAKSHNDDGEKNDTTRTTDDMNKNSSDDVDDEDDDQSSNNDTCPICWFEDEETGTPLRWHFFAGILSAN